MQGERRWSGFGGRGEESRGAFISERTGVERRQRPSMEGDGISLVGNPGGEAGLGAERRGAGLDILSLSCQ